MSVSKGIKKVIIGTNDNVEPSSEHGLIIHNSETLSESTLTISNVDVNFKIITFQDQEIKLNIDNNDIWSFDLTGNFIPVGSKNIGSVTNHINSLISNSIQRSDGSNLEISNTTNSGINLSTNNLLRFTITNNGFLQNAAGNLQISSSSAYINGVTELILGTASVDRWILTSSGDLLPLGLFNIGSSGLRVSNGFFSTIDSNNASFTTINSNVINVLSSINGGSFVGSSLNVGTGNVDGGTYSVAGTTIVSNSRQLQNITRGAIAQLGIINNYIENPTKFRITFDADANYNSDISHIFQTRNVTRWVMNTNNFSNSNNTIILENSTGKINTRQLFGNGTILEFGYTGSTVSWKLNASLGFTNSNDTLQFNSTAGSITGSGTINLSAVGGTAASLALTSSNATLSSSFVAGNVLINSPSGNITLSPSTNTTINSTTIINGSLIVYGLNTTINSTTNINGSLNVSGLNTTINSTTNINGNLNVSGIKSFRINHPLTPESHYLYHGAIESPNGGDTLYDFEVTSTEDDELVMINLPNYWNSLNDNPRGWVQSIDQFAMGYLTFDIDNNKATVHLQKSGTYKVYIMGTRKDPDFINSWVGAEVEKE